MTLERTGQLALVVAFVAMGAAADTVAWWRFGDLGPDGGTAGFTDSFTNSVNPGLYTARPCTFSNQTSSAWLDTRASAWNPAYAPSTTNSFAGYRGLKVYDPVSGETHACSAALHCPWGGDGSNLSGGAVVNVDPALYGQDANGNQTNFTFECFFRTTEAGLARSALMQPLAGIPRPEGDFGAWSLLIYNRHLWSRCTVAGLNGESVDDYVQTSTGQGAEVTPDEWHHAAIVYTVTNMVFRLYLDYKYVTSLTLEMSTHNGRIRAMASNGDKPHLLFGKGTFQNDRSLDGEIAEARFSNEALVPAQFLRFKEEGKAGDRESPDPDTLAWFSMDNLSTGFGGFFQDNVKVDTGMSTNYCGRLVTPEGGVPAVATNDVPGIYGKVGALFGDEMVRFENDGSVLGRTNNCDNTYLRIADPGGALTDDSFTLEFFMKAASQVVNGDSIGNSFGVVGHERFKALAIKDSGKLFFRPYCVGGEHGSTCDTGRIDDGEWHHVAIVYDRDDNYDISVYFDYSRVYHFRGDPLPTGPLTVSTANVVTEFTVGNCRRFGQGEKPQQNFDGQIDEVRLTRRALTAEEFIVRAGQDTGDMLVRIPFDGDTSLFPYGYSGTPAAYVNHTDQAPTPVEGGRARQLITGDDETSIIADTGACRFEGGMLRYPHIAALERSNVTIEFFWRPFEKFAPWPAILGLSGGVDEVLNKSDSPGCTVFASWYFWLDAVWDKAQMYFTVDFVNNDGGTTNNFGIAASPAYAAVETEHKGDSPGWGTAEFDGKWHHVAATLEERVDENSVTTTVVTTYFDYRQRSTRTLNGPVYFRAGKTGLVMQKGYSSSNRLATWDLDEVRITNRVLAPSQFCRAFSGGLKLMLR